jgi:hypothetical protein
LIASYAARFSARTLKSSVSSRSTVKLPGVILSSARTSSWNVAASARFRVAMILRTTPFE